MGCIMTKIKLPQELGDASSFQCKRVALENVQSLAFGMRTIVVVAAVVAEFIVVVVDVLFVVVPAVVLLLCMCLLGRFVVLNLCMLVR